VIEQKSKDARSERSPRPARALGVARTALSAARRRWPTVAVSATLLVGLGGSLGAAGAIAATTTTTPITTTPTPPPSLNAASDQAALTAYRKYLQSLVSSSGLGRERDAVLVSTVASSCQNALTQLSSEPSTPVRQAVLSNFGEEIGGDLALAFLSEAKRPFSKLSTQLGALRWSSTAPATAIRQMLTAERTVLNMQQSSLCADAAEVSSYPRVTPPATASFLTHYLNASATVSRRFQNFLTVLQRYETNSERQLVAAIDNLVGQFGTASTAADQTYSQSILSDLGLVP